ncbi:hypothetical protein U1Q18_051400 [Sarracenia purpurea var. burkii]
MNHKYVNMKYTGSEKVPGLHTFQYFLQKTNESDEIVEEPPDENITTQTPQQPIGNRLEKTQILPMRMFHTYSARLATCIYKNIAYIWNNIANGPLKEVDLFLYSMYRLWPNEINISYVVQGEIEVSPDTIDSGDELLHKYRVPQIIYRIVEWKYEHLSERYKALVVIHNDPNPVPKENRICTDPIKSWNVLEETTKRYSYTCSLSTEVISKLQLDNKMLAPALDLKKFPQMDTTKWKISRENLGPFGKLQAFSKMPQGSSVRSFSLSLPSSTFKYKALVFDVENDELMEIDETKSAKCINCITACAASSDSKEKQQINKNAATDGNAIFLQNVHKNEDTKNIKLDSCKEPLTPAIVYELSCSDFKIGYEVIKNSDNIVSCSLNAMKGIFISFE